MTAVKKFLFDRDFDVPVEPVAASTASEPEAATEPQLPTFSEEDVLAAEQRGYAEGREDGIREAAEATEREIADALAALPQKIDELFQMQMDANVSTTQETLSIATAIARKAFPDLNARNALGEIERMVRDVLAGVIDEPRVQIFVAPALRDPLSERLAIIADRVGYEGRITVAADKALKRGDCRVEWNNGGAQRNLETLWNQIDEIVERNLGHDVPRSLEAAEQAAGERSNGGAEAEQPPSPAADDATAAAESVAESTPETPQPEPATTAEPADDGVPEVAAAETQDVAESPETGDEAAAAPVEAAADDASEGADEPAAETPASAPAESPDIVDDAETAAASEATTEDEDR